MAKKTGEDDVVDPIFTFDGNDDDVVIDMSEVEESKGFELLPTGWYLVDITDDNEREVKKEGGKIPFGTKGANITFTVAEGPFEGRKVWDGFWNHSSSFPYLKKLMAKSGKFTEGTNVKMTFSQIIEQLDGARLWAKVGIRKGTGEYEDQNQIKEYKAEDERSSSTSAADMFR